MQVSFTNFWCFSQFEAFRVAKIYPVLLSCLYFRSLNFSIFKLSFCGVHSEFNDVDIVVEFVKFLLSNVFFSHVIITLHNFFIIVHIVAQVKDIEWLVRIFVWFGIYEKLPSKNLPLYCISLDIMEENGRIANVFDCICSVVIYFLWGGELLSLICCENNEVSSIWNFYQG